MTVLLFFLPSRIGNLQHDNEASLSLASKSQDSTDRSQSKNGLTRHSKASEGYIQTENTCGQLRLAQRLSSSEDEEKIRSRDAIRQKSKEMQQKLLENSTNSGSKKNSQNNSLSQAQASSISSSASGMNDGAGGKERRVKHIVLNPEYRLLSGNETSGVDICQKLFGITVFEYSNGKSNRHHTQRDRKLIVQSVVEGSKAFSSGNISRGDMLIRLNDIDVSWRNFSQLLKSLNKREKVRLTFQSPKIIGPKSTYSVLQVPEADLCQATLGKRLAHIQEELAHLNCVAMYLTLAHSTSESELDQMEDVVYAFPPGEETLTALRGLFITLSSALLDVVEQPALRSHLHLNTSKIHVAYQQCGRDVLVFAMPGKRITPSYLEKVLSTFTSLLVLLFGNVQNAFQDCDRVYLDKLMALTFHRALNLPSGHSIPDFFQWSSLTSMPTSDLWDVRLLGLSNKDKLLCDEILNEFESMDFDDFLDNAELFARRKYVIHGTSLFYKGHLITSHLSDGHQKDVNLFMNGHGLLFLSSREEVNQVFVWHELKSHFNKDLATSLPIGYRPCVTRRFLMVIGLHYYYLSVLVDAGWSPDQDKNLPARPLPLLVEQGRATLAQLEAEEVHMSQCCEESLTSTNRGVALACPDQFCIHYSPRGRAGERDTTSIGKVMSPHNRPREYQS
ncbi:protein inturned-like [Elysia marginata]|uniref:Protein inturned n=1 Tax=Elysia marginata TaxID=1093978 RepID=A0AAV4J1T4_9GAST|nr:protein inturned-like [Elysia marginata]